MDRQRIMEYKEAQKNTPACVTRDERQKEILTNMYYAACAYIGGLENTLYDYGPDEPEHINAKELLREHATIVGEIKDWCMSGFYGCGLEGPQRRYQKEYNRAGNAFIDDCAEKVVTAMGY